MSTGGIKIARELLNHKDFGVLSTLSVKLGGFPFGSVVPYCLDKNGKLVVLISTIAQHTKNIAKDQRCSITILKNNDDIQANGRLCIIGNMELLPQNEEEVKARYYRHFPAAKGYGATHNFSFYRLDPISVRFIGGFGAIHWLEVADFLWDNPFDGKEEIGVIEHMNADHQKSLIGYCEFYKKMTIREEDVVRMVGIDSLGFDVFVNKKKVRFDFESPVKNTVTAREALVSLSKGMA